jgi:hypothetical protein
VEKLKSIPLSDRPWKLYYVAEDQIEPIDSDWYQILTAPGVHVGRKFCGRYRVAIDNSYIPWLSDSKFKFQCDLDPLKPAEVELVHGKWVARRNATARWLQDAIEAIFSGKSSGLDSCYRSQKGKCQMVLEWAILKRDLVTTSLFTCEEWH